MSTTVQSTNDPSPLLQFYTGTREQPDQVNFFLKADGSQGEVSILDDTMINALGHDPRNFLLALPRIQKATQEIYRACSEGSLSSAELWNAIQNLVRGLVQLVPLLGNLALYTYDELKTACYTHPQLKKALAGTEDPVLGVAFDGQEVLFTIPLDEFKSYYASHCPRLQNLNDTDINLENRALLNILYYTWYGLKKVELEKPNSSMTNRQLVEKMQQLFSANR